MSDISMNQFGQLSDSLERELVRMKAAELRAESVLLLLKKALASVKSLGLSAFNYMVDVSRALDEARARDARFSGTQW